MAPSKHIAGGLAGIFSRQGELFTGGPPEGYFQTFHPVARFLFLFIALFAISICKSPLVLAAIFAAFMAVAIVSFLDLKSIYRLMLIPLLVFALPSSIVATLWYHLPLLASVPFLLRTLVSITAAAVIFHSIGLRNMGLILTWFRLPHELRTAWSMMISQVAAFSELVTDMAFARSARQIIPQRGAIIRRQAGTQAAILFARTCRRGDQLTAAMESRRIPESSCDHAASQSTPWTLADTSLVLVGIIIALCTALL